MMPRRPDPCRPDLALRADGGSRIRLEGHAKQAIERGRNRLLMAGVLLAVAFVAIGWRLVDIGLVEQAAEPRLAGARAAQELRMARADIVDRNGVILATSLPTSSLYADPQYVIDAKDAARTLVRVLPELSEAELVARLDSDRRFVWIARHLTPQQKYAVNRLGIPGLYFQHDERRVYPMGRLAAHVLGLTDTDNVGTAGIEQYFDDLLRGGDAPLQLALDVRVQHVLQDELALAVESFDAKGATGLVLDTTSGELVAMASLPDYDPNAPVGGDRDATFNKATLGAYEMGSTFKIFTTAMALDTGAVALDGGYDASHPIRKAGFTIRDYKPKNRWLSVPEIFIYSSNIGAALMALEVGAEGQRQFLDSIGLLRPAEIELPEIGRPQAPATWREINTLTIGFGHGLSVTPLQLASATAAMVNGGVLYPSTLLKRRADERPIGEQVIAPRTSDQMRGLMRLNVLEGTGRRAEAVGYLVGGKTGSAEKVGARGYDSDRMLSSFVGAFPMDAPRYVVVVIVDEPVGNESTGGYATGGVVAAPIVRRVIERAGPLLGVLPAGVIETENTDGAVTHALLHQAAARANGHAVE